MTGHLLLTVELAAEALLCGVLDGTRLSAQRPRGASSPGTSPDVPGGGATARWERVFIALGRGNYEYAIALAAATYAAPASPVVASAAAVMRPL